MMLLSSTLRVAGSCWHVAQLHHAVPCNVVPPQSYTYNYDVATPTFDLGLDVCTIIVGCVSARLHEPMPACGHLEALDA